MGPGEPVSDQPEHRTFDLTTRLQYPSILAWLKFTYTPAGLEKSIDYYLTETLK